MWQVHWNGGINMRISMFYGSSLFISWSYRELIDILRVWVRETLFKVCTHSDSSHSAEKRYFWFKAKVQFHKKIMSFLTGTILLLLLTVMIIIMIYSELKKKKKKFHQTNSTYTNQNLSLKKKRSPNPCKKLNFHYTTKWYMHKAEPVQENNTQTFLWDFGWLVKFYGILTIVGYFMPSPTYKSYNISQITF